MIEAVENAVQRYGSSALTVTIISAVAGGLWWVSDQAHRIKVNESDIREIKSELSGRQDIGPLSVRMLQLEAKYVDVGPILQRLTTLETQQGYLTSAVQRIDETQGRMAERLNTIDRRLAETSTHVITNQEIAKKVLDQQTALAATIADIKRSLPDRPGGFRLQSDESRPEQPGQAGSQSGPPGR